MRTSKFDPDIILYDDALRYIQHLYLVLKECNASFAQGRAALNKLTLIKNEVCDAGKGRN